MERLEKSFLEEVKNNYIEKFPNLKDSVTKGIEQVSHFWDKSVDGDEEEFKKFVETYLITDEKEREFFFQRINRNWEYIFGYLIELLLKLREPIDLDIGELSKFDLLFSRFNPLNHYSEDMFREKIAFAILLNFPQYSLEEKQKKYKNWTSRNWAYARIGDAFISRVPSDVGSELTAVLNEANSYIMHYNIYGDSLLVKGEKLFPSNLKMISHWNLRDEIKALYGKKEAAYEKQKVLYYALKRIVTQEIPEKVINNPRFQWDPVENLLFEDGKKVEFSSEADVRYEYLKRVFEAVEKFDPYYPVYPSAIKRKFELERELSEKEVLELFDQVLTSSVVKKVANLIKERLGRPLEPWDIWYDGFKARSNINEEELDKIVREKYKTSEDFRRDIPHILQKLGFSQKQIEFIAPKIVVDNARGAGHAFGAQMREMKSHLRTRIAREGMDYKGYNIAIHELGHNVEQTISLHKTPYYVLKGIPFTAFTEAFAFLFQKRDLFILGLEAEESEEKKYLGALDALWNTYEMIGVSLVDYYVWKWMYEKKNFSASELKEATIDIARKIWNKYYAPFLGVADEEILAVYSHMISSPLYLADYPLGRIISYQIDKFIEGKNLGEEMERMCSIGSITPQAWMEKAVGEKINPASLLQEAEKACEYFFAKSKKTLEIDG